MEPCAVQQNAVFRESGDYYKALGVIGEYVNITSVDDAPDEGEDFEEGMGMQL